jgi:hypothetical protein
MYAPGFCTGPAPGVAGAVPSCSGMTTSNFGSIS